MSRLRVFMLFEKYGNRQVLTLDEVAAECCVSPKTIINRRSAGTGFAWLNHDGRGLSADVFDLADYLESQRHSVRAALQDQPPHSASASRPTGAQSPASGRRRRIQDHEAQT